MHPAPSVIIFTSLTGLGFGLLVFLGLGLPDTSGVVAFVFFAIAYLLAIGGLISSTFHLGRPERAIKAFSQWRSSWLSREAWLAVASLLVMAIYGAGLVFLDTRWGVLGVIGSALSLATVFFNSDDLCAIKNRTPLEHCPNPIAVYHACSNRRGNPVWICGYGAFNVNFCRHRSNRVLDQRRSSSGPLWHQHGQRHGIGCHGNSQSL